VTSCQKSYILVVDDVPDNILLLQTILELEGYTVDTALSGKSALAKIQVLPPALVLLDIMMPDINGLEVVKHIRQNQNLPFIPIVLVSANNEISRDQGFEVGADDFISKPFDSDELLEKVSNFFQLK
jgi:two-component system sensor histidine kinase/response regulator